MKKFLIALIIFIVFPVFAQAHTINMLFWYPGGEGDSDAAAPLLDEFAKSLKQAIGNKHEIKISYSQNLSTQVPFNLAKPEYQLAIVAYDTYLQLKDKIKGTLVAHSLSLPEGKKSETFYLIGNAQSSLNLAQTISQNRPLSEIYIKQQLFPELKNSKITINTKNNLIGMLKALANDNHSLVLLDAFAWNNIGKLNSDWARALKVVQISSKVPTAPLIAFAPIDPTTQELIKIMLALKSNPILSNLRLAGFTNP